jgi:hypothetical protein
MKSPVFELYQRLPGLVLGFHGCDEGIGEELLSKPNKHLKPSVNEYDWLGNGIYFWENDPQRAWEFAHEAQQKKHLTKGVINKPFVVGAVIDLGLCLNLLDRKGLDEVTEAYQTLDQMKDMGVHIPANIGPGLGQRFLDCSVLETLHGIRADLNQLSAGKHPKYDTVRAAFPEDAPLYDNAGFRKKNHVQIAVREPKCIRGYFRPFVS